MATFAQKKPKAKKPGQGANAGLVGDPTTKSRYATRMHHRWLLADALMGGSEGMRLMGKLLLPQHKNEDDPFYVDRLKKTFLLPVFAQTIESLTDIVFSDPVDHDKTIPDDLVEMLDHIDAEGNSLDVFAKRAFALGLAKGEVYLFADMAEIYPAEGSTTPTLKDKRDANAHPYLCMVSADNMLAYEVETRGGVQRCTYARWVEFETRQAPNFVEEIVERVVEWRVDETSATWRKFERVFGALSSSKDGGVWTVTNGVIAFTDEDGDAALPIVRHRIGQVDSDALLLGALQGLAEKNVEHWQSSSDQRAILTVSRFPMLGGSGVNPTDLQKADGSPGEIKIGPNVTLFARDPQAKYYYVEPTGASIEAGAADLVHLEQDMTMLAYQPLMRQQAGVTATKDALGENKANSSLASWAIEFGKTLDRVVGFMRLWEGQEIVDTAFKPNTEFGIQRLDQVRIDALTKMRASGDLSRPSYLKEMKVERVLSDEFDPEANETELEAEGPAMLPLGTAVPPVGGGPPKAPGPTPPKPPTGKTIPFKKPPAKAA